MTNYNERLDELEEQFLADYRNWNDGPWDYNSLDPKQKFQQAITSLIEELVAEAKPTEKPTDDTNIGSWEEGHQNVGYNRAVKELKKNLLKELETRE